MLRDKLVLVIHENKNAKKIYINYETRFKAHRALWTSYFGISYLIHFTNVHV